jgi:hypothetical protein
MSASEVEYLIAPIDAERIHRPQVLAPGFASHDEGNYPAQQPSRISGVFGDKAGTAHAQLPDDINIRFAMCLMANGQAAGSPKMKGGWPFPKM